MGAVTVGAAAPTSRPAAAVLVDETVARINWSVPAAPQATVDQDRRPSDRLWQESFVTDTAAPAKRAALPDLRIRL